MSLQNQPTLRYQFTKIQLLSLIVLGTSALGISFYLGTIAGKSMLTPVNNVTAYVPENTVNTSNVLLNNARKNDDFDFYELANAKKVETTPKPKVFNLDKYNQLKDKTTQLTTLPIYDEKSDAVDLTKQPTTITTVAPKENIDYDSLQKTSNVKVIPKTELKKPLDSVAATKPILKVENPAPKPVVAKVVSKTLYTVQVGTYGQRSNAESIVSKLLKQGFKAYIHTIVNTQNKKFFRVRVEKADKNTVNSVLLEVKKLPYGGDSKIVKM